MYIYIYKSIICNVGKTKINVVNEWFIYMMYDVDEFQHKSIGYPYIHWFHMGGSIVIGVSP